MGEPVKLPSLLVGWVTNKDIAKVTIFKIANLRTFYEHFMGQSRSTMRILGIRFHIPFSNKPMVMLLILAWKIMNHHQKQQDRATHGWIFTQPGRTMVVHLIFHHLGGLTIPNKKEVLGSWPYKKIDPSINSSNLTAARFVEVAKHWQSAHISAWLSGTCNPQ